MVQSQAYTAFIAKVRAGYYQRRSSCLRGLMLTKGLSRDERVHAKEVVAQYYKDKR